MADSIFKVPKLKGSSNYDIWALRIRSILVQQDCSDILDIPPSDLTSDQYPDTFIKLKEKESKALATIRLSLEDGPLLQTKEHNSLAELWNNLKALYSQEGFSSDFLICKDLINTSLSNCQNNVENYL